MLNLCLESSVIRSKLQNCTKSDEKYSSKTMFKSKKNTAIKVDLLLYVFFFDIVIDLKRNIIDFLIFIYDTLLLLLFNVLDYN